MEHNSMHDAVVVGLGQLGTWYGGALLALGRRVTPVLRSTPRPLMLDADPDAPHLVAVAESQLTAVLTALREVGRHRHTLLLQNEMFRGQWEACGVQQPTVMAVWTHRKGGVVRVGAPTAVMGPDAELVMEMHRVLGVPCRVLSSPEQLDAELAAKYAFIVAVNALGAKADRTVGQWLEQEPDTVSAVVADALRLAEACAGVAPGATANATQVPTVLAALAAIPTRGRTAADRVARAAAAAASHGLHLPGLCNLLPQTFAAP